MKEIKVRLYAHKNDSYVELYKVIGGDTKEAYFARATNRNGTDGEWCFVSDPLGYRELDRSCSDSYLFIVCDSKGKELFRDSNGEIMNPFPTLERKAILTWDEIIKGYPCKKEGLNDWLLSFLTKDMAEEKLKDLPCHEENWPYWYDVLSKSIIHRSSHLGENYCIYKVTNKHRYCDCVWVDYFSGYEVMDEYTGYIKWHGACFEESNVGPNYSRRIAIKIVIEALQKIYESKYSLSHINQTEYGDFEKKMRYADAAEFLLKGNYNRSFVHEITNREKERRTFYDSHAEIRKAFPNAVMDYAFRY